MANFSAILKLIAVICLINHLTAASSSKSKSEKSKSKRKRERNWTGSKIGTTEYNKEIEVIETAKVDYSIGRKAESYLQRKLLLCVVFMRPAAKDMVQKNIAHMGTGCEWAVVFYDGKDKVIETFCGDITAGNIIHCKLAAQAFTNKNASDISRRGIPKSVLYADLVPYLSGYQRIFLMDEDISLLDFNLNKFLKIWDCALRNQPPPLIVQPVIAEPTQYFNFVLQQTWKDTGVVATASGLVEQQVPFFDAIFFEWFVRRVLVTTRDVAAKYGADWGHDRSWCNAAKMYSMNVLGWKNKTFPCAIITGAPPVHHLNTHAMENKRKDRNAFRANGVIVVQHYVNLYPTWVQLDITKAPNPTDKVHGKKYVKIRILNETCMRVRGNDNLFMLRQTVPA